MSITKPGFEFVFDRSVAEWVSERLPEPCEFGDCAAIGLMDGGVPIAGVVYTNWIIGPAGPHSIEMDIAAEGKRWAHRRTLKVFFGFAFENLKANRVTAITQPYNAACIDMLERLGLQREGTLRQGYPSGTDALLYGMLKSECRWL